MEKDLSVQILTQIINLFILKFKMFNVANNFWFSYNSVVDLAKKVAQILIQKHKTLCTAESCTGGLLSHLLTNVPGSSQFFKLGVATYANEAKVGILSVPQRIIVSHGAVSPQTVTRMAQGARKISRTDLSVAISGIAGPTGATPGKPVGLVFIAIASQDKTTVYKFHFRGTRTSVKKQAVKKALALLLRSLNEK